MSDKGEWGRRLGELVYRYRCARGMTQAALAELVSRELGERVGQTAVSAHESGARWAENAGVLLGAYARVLDIPHDEAVSALGFSVGSGAKGTRRRRGGKPFAEMVDSDPTLSPTAKEHLREQYRLLQMATEHERGHGDEGQAREA